MQVHTKHSFRLSTPTVIAHVFVDNLYGDIGALGDELFDVREYFAEILQLTIFCVYHRLKDLGSFKNIERFIDGTCTTTFCHDLVRSIWKLDCPPTEGASPATSSKNPKKRTSSFLDDSDDEEDDSTADPTVLADELSAYIGAISPPHRLMPSLLVENARELVPVRGAYGPHLSRVPGFYSWPGKDVFQGGEDA